MVQQAYVHRLALGRSAFERPARPPGDDQTEEDTTVYQEPVILEDGSPSPDFVQIFNSRGHPQNLASRSQVRRNITAYNEVLATVDVCARIDEDGKPVFRRKDSKDAVNEEDDSVPDESETGFWFSFADKLIRLVATTVTVNLRRRIQTFDFYGGIPLYTILRVELAHQGFVQLFLAGQFANTASGILVGTLENLIDEGQDMLLDRFVTTKHRKSQRLSNSIAIHTGGRILKFATFCALFPLQLYSGLQRLNLIPYWPLLPNPFSRSFFAIVFPPIPRNWNRRSLAVWSSAFIMSPVMASIAMHFLADQLQGKLLQYARSTIPRPDNPDRVSYKMIEDDDLDGSTPMLNYPRLQGSLGEVVRKDMEALIQGAGDLRIQLRNTLRRLFSGKRPSVEFPNIGEDDLLAEAESPLQQRHVEQVLEAEGERVTTASTPAPLNTRDTPIVRPNSPLLTPTSSEGNDEFNGVSNSNVQIRTRTGSTSTLHVDVEFNFSARAGGPTRTSSFATSPHSMAAVETALTGSTSTPHHRVTSLSLLAADSMSVHLTTTIIALFRLPLEAFYTRAIARGYLDAPNPPTWLSQHVYPSNCWFGIVPPYSYWDYSSKILLCLGVETMITAQVWQAICRVAFWAGKRWYGWGKL